MIQKESKWYEYHYCYNCRRPLKRSQIRRVPHFDNPRTECVFCDDVVEAVGWVGSIILAIGFAVAIVVAVTGIMETGQIAVIGVFMGSVLFVRLIVQDKHKSIYKEWTNKYGIEPAKWPPQHDSSEGN